MTGLRDLAASAALLMLAAAGAIGFADGNAPSHVGQVAPKAKAAAAPRLALVVAPRRDATLPRGIARAVSPEPLPPNAVAAAPLPPQAIAPDPALSAEQASLVAARLSQKVPPSLAPYFDTFIYVSKAAGGPWGQHLFLFHKNADGTLAFEESFAVSTGRERSEQYFTATPTGLFELDVHRFFPMARSAKWNDAEMPWAMFLNYAYRTQMSGVALHAATGRHEMADIGHRASGGCVRLPIEKADALFHRFLKEERGQVPVLTFDSGRGTTNTDGIVAHDGQGDVVLADGLRVLVIIEDYQGEAAPGTQS